MALSDMFDKNAAKADEPSKKENEAKVAHGVAEFREKKDLIFNDFKEKNSELSIKLTPVCRKTGLTDSKFGGKPYFPKGMEYPCNSEGMPLWFLAQLNFQQLPKLAQFPQKGILQFYIANDDVFGLDFDNPPTVQNGFRIIYHENIVGADEMELNVPEFTGDEFPFTAEFALNAEIKPNYMSISDFRFDKSLFEAYKKHISTEAETLYDLEDEIMDEIYEEFTGEGHRVGGYPFFTQNDPREFEDEYQTYTIMLFQMDSDMVDDENEIIWGDCGVANFFINPDKLEKLDFSSVIYNWDCY